MDVIGKKDKKLPQFGRFQNWHGVGSFRMDFLKMKKLSQKDLIIALGVLVAAIILVVSIYFKDPALLNENASGKPMTPKKIQPAAVIGHILKNFSAKVFR